MCMPYGMVLRNRSCFYVRLWRCVVDAWFCGGRPANDLLTLTCLYVTVLYLLDTVNYLRRDCISQVYTDSGETSMPL